MDNNKYKVGAIYPRGDDFGLYEQHISIRSDLDDEGRLVFSYGGHYATGAELKFVRTNSVLSLDNYNNSNTYGDPVIVHNNNDGGAYHELKYIRGDTIVIADNRDNMDFMALHWSHDNGQTWQYRDYTYGEVYGHKKFFYDSSEDKWIFLVTAWSGQQDGNGIDWRENNLKFHYSTLKDIINGKGVRSSSMSYNNFIPKNLKLKIQDVDISGQDNLPYDFDSDSYYDNSTDRFYILANNFLNIEQGLDKAKDNLVLLYKTRATSNNWTAVEITSFPCFGKRFMKLPNELFFAACVYDDGVNNWLLYATTKTPLDPNSYDWKKFTDYKLDTYYDQRKAFRIFNIKVNPFDERIIYFYGDFALENSNAHGPIGLSANFSWVDFIDDRNSDNSNQLGEHTMLKYSGTFDSLGLSPEFSKKASILDINNNIELNKVGHVRLSYDEGFGGFVTLDGNGDFLYASNDNSFDFNGIEDDFAISVWINPSGKTGNPQMIVSKKFGATGNYFILIDNEPFDIRFGAQRDENIGSSTIIPFNTWTHVVLSYANGRITLYLNGQEDVSADSIGPKSFASDFLIGARRTLSNSDSSLYFKGSIGKVMVFDRALNPEEVSELYDTAIYY